MAKAAVLATAGAETLANTGAEALAITGAEVLAMPSARRAHAASYARAPGAASLGLFSLPLGLSHALAMAGASWGARRGMVGSGMVFGFFVWF